jgi:Protein of unknown function (DUF3618)
MTAPNEGTGRGPVPTDTTPTQPVPTEPAELERDIEQTRERLGETVEALAAKTDVKARAKEKASEISSQMRAKGAAVSGRVKNTGAVTARQATTAVRSNAVPVAAAAAAVAAVLFAIGWWRGHG